MNHNIIVKDDVPGDVQRLPNDDSNNALTNRNCDDTDQLVQFMTDQFILDQFHMNLSKKKQSINDFQVLVKTLSAIEKHCWTDSNMDKNHNKKQTDNTEDRNTRIIDILKKRGDNNNKIIKDSMDAKTKKLESLLREAFAAYQGKHWTTAAVKYKTALEIITNSEGELQNVVNGDVVCYMLCITWLETSQLNNLTEALQSLKNLENRGAHVLPAVYCALSKVHQKLFRFGLALKTVQKGFDFLNSNVEFQPYNIPGSNILLDETTRDGLSIALATIKEECSKWHIPDAVCGMTECISSSMHYGPSRDIFIRDPTFNGMVTVTCSNTRNPCNINFHQACWKLKKDQISPLTKLSDKDVIGHECFTPNCENDKEEVSLIAKIDIIGEDGQVKAHIEAPPNPVAKVKCSIITKGAIPKQTVKPRKPLDRIKKPKIAPLPTVPKETVNDGDTEMAWRLSLLKDLRRKNFGIKPENEWRPDREMYGNPQMKIVFEFLEGPVAANDSSKMVDFKSFVYTYFYEFIKENGYVKTLDILQHWEESKTIFTNSAPDLHVDIDICEFLIESQKISKIDDYFCIAENLPMLYGVIKDQLQNCLRFVLMDPPSMKAAALEDDDILNLIAHTQQKSNLLSKIEDESEEKIDARHQLNCQKSIKDIQTTTISQAVAEFVENPGSSIFFNTADDNFEDQINSNVNYPDEIQRSSDNSEPQSLLESWNSYDDEALDNRLEIEKANSTMIETENFSDTELANDVCYHSAESDAGETNGIGLENCEPEIDDSETCESETVESETSEVEDTESDITVNLDLKCGETEEQNTPRSLSKLESQNLTVQRLKMKMENDAAANLKIIEQLKATLRQTDERSENHARQLQAAFEIQRKVFQTRLTVLVKNLTQLESDNAKLELDNSVSAENCKKLSIDLETLKCAHNTLISQKNQSDNNYIRLNEDLRKLKDAYSLLELGNRSYNSRIENFNQERHELEHKLHECQTFLQEEKQEKERLLGEKNMLEQENAELVQTLSSLRHSNEVLKRDIKLHEIKQEYLMNEQKCKNMMDRGSFYLETLSGVSRIIWDLTKQNLDANESRSMWEKTFSTISDLITKNQEDYLRLKKMLDSADPIDNLNELTLPRLNIEPPKVYSVAEIFYNQRASFLPVLPPPLRYCMPQDTRNPYPPPAQGLGLPFMMPHMNAPPYNNQPNTLPIPHPAFMNNMRPPMYMSPNKPHFLSPSNPNLLSPSIFHMNSNERNTGRKHSGDVNRSSSTDSGDRTKTNTEFVKTAVTENLKLVEQNRGSMKTMLSSENGITSNLPENPPATCSVERQETPQKTFGFDRLIGRLRKKFIGVPELDLLESIQELRASRSGTLSGMTIDQITREIESFVKKHQAKHLIFNAEIEQPEAPVPLQKKTQSKFVPVTARNVSSNGKQPRSSLKEMDLQFKKHELPAKPVKPAVSNKPVWAPVTSNFVNWKKDDDECECVICMEKMTLHDKLSPVYVLPCQHSFHTSCIKLWLTENSVCPNCRIHCTMNDEFPPLPS